MYPDPELGCLMELSADRSLTARTAHDRGLIVVRAVARTKQGRPTRETVANVPVWNR